VERNDDSWPTSINAYHDTGDPDRDCAGRVVGSPPRGAGIRRADRQQSDRHTASQCRVANHTSSNPVRHHDTGCNDCSNRDSNSGSDCYTGSDASRKLDSVSDDNSYGDAPRDESANSISNQHSERNDSANDDSDRDTDSQTYVRNDANPGKHSNAHPTTKRKREGDTGACADGLDEHHL
jgi:hypothetical protein